MLKLFDNETVKKALHKVYEDAQRGEKYNLMPSMIAAAKAHATAAETMGVIRMANGLSYDPFDMIESPFSFG